MLFCTFILAGCYISGVTIGQTFDVPDDVQEEINTDYQLQHIKKRFYSYIVFQSAGTITAKFEVIDSILHIDFTIENEENTESNMYLYKMDPGHVEVKVFINGEETPFDSIVELY